MNPEQEAFFTYAVRQNRRLCTDCLLKEHRHLFCPVCLDVPPPPEESIVCHNCPSVAHLACPPPPPCSDPNFSFFPTSKKMILHCCFRLETEIAHIVFASFVLSLSSR
ncbi:hypothetical protein YC2023_012266 [Brassica napus]